MNEFTFSKYLAAHFDTDEAILNQLLAECKRKHFDKGDFLVRAGDICHFTFFVENGLLSQYSIDEKGKEHILNFAPEGWFVNDRESMYFDNPSQFFIEALEDTDVFIMDNQLTCELDINVPGFTKFNADLLHNHIRALQNRINQLLSTTAEERYLSFMKMYPDILQRVPQWMIASYLGITPESLSRVRKKII